METTAKETNQGDVPGRQKERQQEMDVSGGPDLQGSGSRAWSAGQREQSLGAAPSSPGWRAPSGSREGYDRGRHLFQRWFFL